MPHMDKNWYPPYFKGWQTFSSNVYLKKSYKINIKDIDQKFLRKVNKSYDKTDYQLKLEICDATYR